MKIYIYGKINLNNQREKKSIQKKFFHRKIEEKCLVKNFPFSDKLTMILWVLLIKQAREKLKRLINPWH